MKNKNIDSQELGELGSWWEQAQAAPPVTTITANVNGGSGSWGGWINNIDPFAEARAFEDIRANFKLDYTQLDELKKAQREENNGVQMDSSGFRKWLEVKQAAITTAAAAAAQAAVVAPQPLIVPSTEIIVPVVKPHTSQPPVVAVVDTPPEEDKPPVVEKKNNTLLYAGIAGAVLLALGITAAVVMNKD